MAYHHELLEQANELAQQEHSESGRFTALRIFRILRPFPLADF
jgi:hypothetical protein